MMVRNINKSFGWISMDSIQARITPYNPVHPELSAILPFALLGSGALHL
jgi:hypothetical protein